MLMEHDPRLCSPQRRRDPATALRSAVSADARRGGAPQSSLWGLLRCAPQKLGLMRPEYCSPALSPSTLGPVRSREQCHCQHGRCSHQGHAAVLRDAGTGADDLITDAGDKNPSPMLKRRCGLLG